MTEKYTWFGVECKTPDCKNRAKSKGYCLACLHKQWRKKNKDYYKRYYKEHKKQAIGGK